MIVTRAHTAHPLASGIPPTWASEWGEDEYGVFCGFRVGNVTQILRWIPPSEGPVMLGSPDTEPGRGRNETLHEVDFDEGFWLADTACTQALWQIVMRNESNDGRNNPSRFTTWEADPWLAPQLPVEQVRWDNCQVFLRRLNERLPELGARLPKEAEWEYACRADTRTAFSVGDQIDSRLVNFGGNFPQPAGKKSEYRQRTVPTRTLPPNPWGLFEMHGNVWEWCGDWLGDYPKERVRNAEWNGPEDGVYRVLRGGSWNLHAQFARSARRYGFHPGNEWRYFGFRLLVPGLR